MSDNSGNDSEQESGKDDEPEADESAFRKVDGTIGSNRNRDMDGNIESDRDGAGGGNQNDEKAGTVSDPENPFAELEEFNESDVTPAEIDNLFEPVETTDVDEEALWDAVLSTEEDPGDTAGADAVVSKHQYCKRCEFFSAPPDVACRNPGTEITELVGVDRFQVRNCPVVAQRNQTRTAFPDE